MPARDEQLAHWRRISKAADLSIHVRLVPVADQLGVSVALPIAMVGCWCKCLEDAIFTDDPSADILCDAVIRIDAERLLYAYACLHLVSVWIWWRQDDAETMDQLSRMITEWYGVPQSLRDSWNTLKFGSDDLENLKALSRFLHREFDPVFALPGSECRLSLGVLNAATHVLVSVIEFSTDTEFQQQCIQELAALRRKYLPGSSA